MTEPKRRPIRSFVLRQGRLTPAQQNALDHYWQDFGIDYTESPLDLNTVFGRDAPITLEIGFGNGDSLLEQAQLFPDCNFLGIEVHRPGVGHLLNRIHQEQVSNLRIINHDAIEVLNHQIKKNSLHRVQIFFPDPWHKTKHNKRRIVQNDFIEIIANRLHSRGIFHLATDWENYAKHMLSTLNNCKLFSNLSSDKTYSPKPDERPTTKFEKRGLKLGHSVWDLIYIKL